MKTKIIFVGGFLGAGKTTLLFKAARSLIERGKRVGLITNDQASELVDTIFLEYTKGAISEVSGSCFCCNLKGLTEAISHLMKDKQVDIILAEPVGSCTDLSATILQPLKQDFGKDLVIAPLTVLVDPERLSDTLYGEESGLHSSTAYIMRKQLEEADIIVINKIDLLNYNDYVSLRNRVVEDWTAATIHGMSAQTGEGLELWLNEITNRFDAGTRLAEVDYDIYAEGEAVLGWLNATIILRGESVDWDIFTNSLLNALSRRFDSLNYGVGHVKLIIQASECFIIGNFTGKQDTLSIRGSVGIKEEVKMVLNARVQIDPSILESIILEEISTACGSGITFRPVALKCLSPGRPNPTQKYDHIVEISS